jgi:uncharacterized protein YdaU (DUF1376 family)
MNFYKHYIGDFQRDTGHLSLTERGAYLALIHHYYATEKPLPTDMDSLCRIAGAVTKLEQAAVKTVLGFFELVDSGLMHSRIEAEIHKAGEISNMNRDIAIQREAKRRAEKEARKQHEPSTERAPSVARNEHEQSTNQTPDTRQDTETNVSVVGAKAPPACPHLEIIGLYNTILPELTQVLPERWGGSRAKQLQARWRESDLHQSLAFWESYFTELRNHPFYLGQNDRAWRADLEWLTQRKNFDKMVERFVSGQRAAA